MERRGPIFAGDKNQDDPRLKTWRTLHLVAATGHVQSTFATDYLGIPATHGVVHLRYAEVHFAKGDRIRQSWVMFDLLDLMRQAGVWSLPSSLGTEGMLPGPATQGGLRLMGRDNDASNGPDTVFKMHNAGVYAYQPFPVRGPFDVITAYAIAFCRHSNRVLWGRRNGHISSTRR